jgi:hypothetical protein
VAEDNLRHEPVVCSAWDQTRACQIAQRNRDCSPVGHGESEWTISLSTVAARVAAAGSHVESPHIAKRKYEQVELSGLGSPLPTTPAWSIKPSHNTLQLPISRYPPAEGDPFRFFLGLLAIL